MACYGKGKGHKGEMGKGGGMAGTGKGMWQAWAGIKGKGHKGRQGMDEGR